MIFALRACDDDGLRFEQRGTLRAEGANAGAGASGADRGERLAFRLGLIEVGLALVDVADLQGGAGYKLDILRLACCQCPLEAALPDEEHETEQINRHQRYHGVGLHSDDSDLLGERAGKEPDIVQRVYDAGEEAVDEYGVDAAVARCLRALDHHERDCHAVHRIQDGGLPSGVAAAAKRKHQKRGDEQREGDAVGVGHVHANILELPEHQNADACN